jgi:hypothetical protein
MSRRDTRTGSQTWRNTTIFSVKVGKWDTIVTRDRLAAIWTKEVNLTVSLFPSECVLINICPSVKTGRLVWAAGGCKTKWRGKMWDVGGRVLKLIAVSDCEGTACDGPPVQFGTEPNGMSECVCFTSFGKPRDTIWNLISFLAAHPYAMVHLATQVGLHYPFSTERSLSPCGI